MQRTRETFQLHLEKRVAVCGTFYLVLKSDSVLGEEYMIVPNACSSNYCLTCRRANLRRLRGALVRSMATHRWRLVTLTFARRNIDTVEQLRALRKSFDLLSKRMRRRFPGISYVRTIEIHKDGYPHVHVVVDRYMPVAWLQLHWKECGGGIVDIREGKRCNVCRRRPPCEHYKRPRRFTHHDAAKYLTEEIEKQEQDPHKLGEAYWCAGVRSVSVSRGLKLKNDASPWKYHEQAHTWDDIERILELASWYATMHDQPQPTLGTSGSMAFIGAGYRTR